MEREGEVGEVGREGEMKRRRRGGGEMRKGIIVGGMILSLLMGCNNGIAELEKKNQFLSSLANLGNDFLSVSTSFGDIFTETLGFKADTSKKEEVGKYFKNIETSLSKTKTTLEKLVNDMKKEGNPNAEATDGAVKILNGKLDEIIKGASEALKGVGDNELIANVAAGGSGGAQGVAGEASSIKFITEGIGKIVGVVLGNNGSAEAGDNKGSVQDTGNDATSRSGTDGAGKLFSNTDAGAKAVAPKVAKDALKAVGAVSGSDILKAIAKGEGGDAAKLAKSTDGTAANGKNDAVVAGGIALLAMTKGGKFANTSENSGTAKIDIATEIKGVAITAVTKTLDTLTIAIRKTIDEELKKVKEAMNINANAAPVTTTEAKN